MLRSNQLGGADDADSLKRIWPDYLYQFLDHLRRHNLLIHIQHSALPNDNAVSFLDDTIRSHLASHHLAMPSATASLNLVMPPTDASPSSLASPSAHLVFRSLIWKLVHTGYRRVARSSPYHQVTNSPLPHHAITWHNLFSDAPHTPGKDHRRIQNIENRPLLLIGMAAA